MTGKVYLVGAGPGDPGLLTLRAKKLLEEADLVVYDYLANPDHLLHAKSSARKIGVGKGFRHRRLSQNKVNALIVSAAKNGQSVVRLKGGDPYLFGRGGEEALFLHAHRIPFEVVPGVTSASACAAYAGIPLTHREHNASVTFLTGHRADDENLDSISWKEIVALGGTIVVYMGFYNLKNICARLIQNGKPKETPVAIVEWGSLPHQKTCRGMLEDIAATVKKSGMKPPCLILIGQVVTLQDKLNWFEKLPLFGKTVVVTRAADKSQVFREKLALYGAGVIEFPVIEIKKVPDTAIMDKAIRGIDHYDWLVFTSHYGVRAFFDRLSAHGKDARALGQARVAAVGPATACSLKNRGVKADLLPKHYETKAIITAFKEKKINSLKGKSALLLRTDIAPVGLEEGLEKLGAKTTRVTAYLTRMPKQKPNPSLVLGRRVDYVTFTSSSTVDNFVKIVGLQKARALSQKSVFVSIGPVTTKTLLSYGLKAGCQAKMYTTDGLIKAILSYRGDRRGDRRDIFTLKPRFLGRLRRPRNDNWNKGKR
ncbi:MAG: uroporphyrinogen-III C-methyltransferase [Candidatus Omnitrophica bacterium]|nr:uroporphyrinogen-III C-methyltransferase [Candidatus Omnitrophota bacterium]